jgi:hypothetical protein
MDPSVSFPENWTAPRELTRALPRETSMTGRAIAVVIMGGLFLLGSVPLFIFFRGENVRQTARAEALRTQSLQATGEIVRLWHSDNKEHTPMVTYAFTANGIRLQGDSSVPEKLWEGIRKAGFMPIRYLPSDPSINHPLAWEPSIEPAWVPFTLPVLLAGVAIGLLIHVRRQGQVAAEGVPAVGVVNRCFRVKGGWAVRYQFRMKDGAIARGSSQAGHRLEVGSAICVLYLPPNPRRNQMYPLRFYRVTQ